MFNFDLTKFSEEAKKAGRTVKQQIEFMKGLGVDISDIVAEAEKSEKDALIATIKPELDELYEFEVKRQTASIVKEIEKQFGPNYGAQRNDKPRSKQEQSKWKLYLDDVEINGVPKGSEFTTIEEDAMSKWNWLGYEIQKIKQPNNIPTTLFKNRISLAGVAAYYKPRGVEKWDWKEAVRSGKIAERISVEIGKEVKIEEEASEK